MDQASSERKTGGLPPGKAARADCQARGRRRRAGAYQYDGVPAVSAADVPPDGRSCPPARTDGQSTEGALGMAQREGALGTKGRCAGVARREGALAWHEGRVRWAGDRP